MQRLGSLGARSVHTQVVGWTLVCIIDSIEIHTLLQRHTSKNKMLGLTLVILVTAHNLHGTIAASTKRASNQDLIHFPETVGLENKFDVNDVPEECKDKTFCTIKPKNYPEEQFNKMLKGMNHLPQPMMSPEPMLTNRQGEIDERKVCESKEEYGPIYQARSKRDSEWKTVVQASDVGYQQRFHTETCVNPDGPSTNLFPPSQDFVIFCKQIYREFEVMIANGTGTARDKVDVPICCSCEYKTAPIESRFGIPKVGPVTQKP